MGEFAWAAPPVYYHPEQCKGLMTTEDNKYYLASVDIGQTITTKDKDLIISFQVTATREQKCTGNYLKFFGEFFDQYHFSGDSSYEIMFGPDYCQAVNDNVHLILRRNGKEFKMTDRVRAYHDQHTHLYTFRMYKNHTYSVEVDERVVSHGWMSDRWKCFVHPEV